MAGRVNALELCAPAFRQYLADPQLSLLPRESWPDRLGSTPVRVAPGEWDEILAGLHARDIVSFIRPEDMIRHVSPDGEETRLSSGLFAVPKGDIGAAGFCAETAPQRLIVNAVPSNSIQRPIAGDIATLPLFD